MWSATLFACLLVLRVGSTLHNWCTAPPPLIGGWWFCYGLIVGWYSSIKVAALVQCRLNSSPSTISGFLVKFERCKCSLPPPRGALFASGSGSGFLCLPACVYCVVHVATHTFCAIMAIQLQLSPPLFGNCGYGGFPTSASQLVTSTGAGFVFNTMDGQQSCDHQFWAGPPAWWPRSTRHKVCVQNDGVFPPVLQPPWLNLCTRGFLIRTQPFVIG